MQKIDQESVNNAVKNFEILLEKIDRLIKNFEFMLKKKRKLDYS